MSAHPHSVNLSLQVVPLNCSQAYPPIDAAIAAIQQSGVSHQVTAFSTQMEGPLEELLQVVAQAREAAFAAGAEELLLNIQIHLKKQAGVSLQEKVEKHSPP